uniref:Uncharacterized protein n=1 Tax=Culex tarsalis TaxID=7177 RepID=A0A1Q3EVP6_CULTA
MIRSVKTETTRRREVEDVPDQAILDASQRPLVAGGPEISPAAAQQQHFHHSPFLQHLPLHAEPYIQWFAEHQGYVTELLRQQQEALQHQLEVMQQQQLAFIQHQQQLIHNIVTSMKVQALPCLDVTSDSLGSGNAEEFVTDPDGDGVPKPWQNRQEELLQEKKLRSLDKKAEDSRCGSGGRLGGEPDTEFRMPELEHKQDDLRSPGAKVGLGTIQQQALAGSCDVRGYLDDVIEHLSEVNQNMKQQTSATWTPLHSPPVPDPLPKPTRPLMGENVEFAGPNEVPLWLVVNVNTCQQFHSAVIAQLNNSAAAKDRVRNNTAEAFRSTVQRLVVAGDPPLGGRQSIRSKLEFEPPPSTASTTLPGEPEKRKFCANVPDAINNKAGRVMSWTVVPRTARRAGCWDSECRVTSDVWLEWRTYTKSSEVSGSTTPTRFDTSKQPSWSLGRPPEFGGTCLSASVSSRSSTIGTPSQSVVSPSGCARVLVPRGSSPRRCLA